MRTNVGLTCRHGANEHDGARAFRKVLVHFTHLLRVDARALLKLNGLGLDIQLRLGCGARLGFGSGLSRIHRRDFLGHRLGRRNLNLAEQRRGRTQRLGRSGLGCGGCGSFGLCRLLARLLLGHALQGAEQLQAQVLVQAQRRVGVLRHRGGVQAHTLRARGSGGQAANPRTHQVSRGRHARSRARRRNRRDSLTSLNARNLSARRLNSLLSRGRCTGFRARRSAPSRTLRSRSNTRKGARRDGVNARRLNRKGHYASQPATLDSHARDAGIASR